MKWWTKSTYTCCKDSFSIVFLHCFAYRQRSVVNNNKIKCLTSHYREIKWIFFTVERKTNKSAGRKKVFEFFIASFVFFSFTPSPYWNTGSTTDLDSFSQHFGVGTKFFFQVIIKFNVIRETELDTWFTNPALFRSSFHCHYRIMQLQKWILQVGQVAYLMYVGGGLPVYSH